jgi:hypothetical protein
MDLGTESSIQKNRTTRRIRGAILLLEKESGKGKYILAEYEKIKRITMPLSDNHLLYVTTEPEADHMSIIRNVEEMVKRKKIIEIVSIF